MIVELKSIVPLLALVSSVVAAVSVTGPLISMLLPAVFSAVVIVPPRCTPVVPLRVTVLNAPAAFAPATFPAIFTVPPLFTPV